MEFERLGFVSPRDFVVLLQACAKQKDLHAGIIVHADIVKRGFIRNNIFIGSTLVHMYAKCGAIAKAHQVFYELPVQDDVSWSVLITGYVQGGHGEEALECFEHMKHQGFFLDAVTFAGILKACASIGAEHKGKEIHSEIIKKGWLWKDSVLGTALVDMYGKCGALAKAQQMFDQLPIRDIVSWNALIAGYVHHGHSDEAFYCFQQMKHDGLVPNAATFACILKACGSIGAGEKGVEIHDEIVRKGLHRKDSVLGTALVDMYAKCGALARAQQVFDELPVRDVISWNALSTAYCQHGQGDKALECFQQMKCDGISPGEVSFSCALKACASIGISEKGNKIHAEIIKEGFEKSNLLGNALVDMYAKCGALAKAQQMFGELLIQDIVSWNALIAGYAQHGYSEEALYCFEQMQGKGFSPDAITFLSILKACGGIGKAEKGKEMHAKIVRMGFLGEDSVLGTALVEMYAKFGALAMAGQVFGELPVRDVVSWTGLIAGYAQHQQGEEALSCFERMQGEGLSPNAVTFACVLKACGSIRATEKGKEIHAEISRQGLLGDNIVLGNALVDMYAKCGAFSNAQQSFDELPKRDVVSWNALMAGYAQVEKHEIVMNSFRKMIEERIEPSLVTFTIVLRACKYLDLVEDAQMYFEMMTTKYGIIPTLEHHTCMVDLFGHAGHFDKVMDVIKEVPCSDSLPVWFALLCVCRKWENVELGRLAFEHAIRMDENSVVAYVYMSNIYAAAGVIEDANKTFMKAQQVFNKLAVREIVSWNALIAGYCEHGHGEEALDCFEQMEREGLCPNAETFLHLLKACGSIGAVQKGKEVHNEIVRTGFLGVGVLGSALVDMYTKCGAIAEAQEVFDELPIWDVVCWTALISGYCQHGHGEDALYLFESMMGVGLSPDAVTFACILNVCSSMGAIEKGQRYFDIMRTCYGIDPLVEHYTCMVGLFGCAGHFDKAVAVIEKMPSSDIFLAWFTLLSACKKWGNVKFGRLAFDHAVQSDDKSALAYVCMSNIYAAAGMQEDAAKIGALRMENEAWSNLGCH